MCMYVHVYVCLYMNLCACVCMCMSVYIFICVCVCMHRKVPLEARDVASWEMEVQAGGKPSSQCWDEVETSARIAQIGNG